ncbi:MAG: hypothetical protein AAF936_12200 [Pseudomonadota bacterium]
MKTEQIVAFGIAVGIGGAGILWGFSKLLPAFGVAIGLAISIATTGVVSSGAIAGWIVPTASAGVAAAGFGAAYLIVVKAMDAAEKAPFNWSVPALAILAGFLVEICKEFYPASPLIKILFATVAAFLILVGGVLFTRAGMKWKIPAAGMQIAPPLLILLLIISESEETKLLMAVKEISFATWAALLGMLSVAAGVMYLARNKKV